jgi:His-Xaa-Ser system radical SAM maturase HxsB
MSEITAEASVERLFESSASNLTVEFQGGEPLLAFPIIRQIAEAIKVRNAAERRTITFTITTTLHHLTDEILQFLREHQFNVSTSLDGPAWLHDANRPLPTRDAHARTLAGIERARAALGSDRISALTTLTRRSLEHPEAIVDEYLRLQFPSIFLRPLSPYGFAVRAERKIGYGMEEFVRFYERALTYILKKNSEGSALEEAYTTILLTHILTPFPSGYVDLRSPTGAGHSTLVYNYDGSVYASDEGRMLAEMGDLTFRLGDVTHSYGSLMSSPAMNILREAGLAETRPGCSECVFVPYCGADPVHMKATLGDPFAEPMKSSHCTRHMGLFRILFRHLAEADPSTMRTFLAWVTGKSPVELDHERVN